MERYLQILNPTLLENTPVLRAASESRPQDPGPLDPSQPNLFNFIRTFARSLRPDSDLTKDLPDHTRSIEPEPDRAHRGTIDSFRGMVCLGVMVMHFFMIIGVSVSGGYIGWCVQFVLVYCRLGVESFFVLAGYFLAHTFRPTEARYLSVRRHVQRRFLRLAIPYWTVVALLFLAAWAANVLLGRSNRLPTTGQVMATVLFTQDIFFNRSFPFFTLWSMAPLFQFYLVWTLAYWMVRRVGLWLYPAAYQVLTQRVMIGVSYVVLVGSLGGARSWATEGWQLPRWAWAFAVGALTYWLARRLTGWRLYALAVGALFPAAVLLGGPSLSAAKVSVCAAVLLAFGRGIQVPDCLATRVLGHVGQRSYSLYLVHGPVGFRIIGWASLVTDPGDPLVSLSVFIASLAASVAAGLVFYRLVERPVARLAGGVEYRR